MTPEPLRLDGEFGTVAGFRLGNGSGRPLVMLHASGTGPATLLALAQTAAEAGRTVWVPGFDGYGGTAIAGGGESIARHCTVLEAVLAALGGEVELFGHSMGGLIALTVAARGALPVRGITAVEPVAIGVLREHAEDAAALAPDAEAVAKIAPAMAEGRHEDAVRDFISLWNGRAWDKMPEKMRTAIIRMAPQIHADTSSVSFATTPAAHYSSIPCPVRLVATERGPVTAHAVIRRLLSANTAWREERIAGVGHMGPIEAPAAFAHLVS
ncbi:MAG: alpha/beta fold hydrolase [Minwuia sp.]|uniref:alpha/beta fold hydrolase n=1 Tax=Minwuia sp. TaxID=2493630 RepID=UPI003A8593DA